MLLGGHVSSSGGVQNSITNAEELKVDCYQTFLSAPQSYKIFPPAEEKIAEFRKRREAAKDIKKYYAHAIYLLNFASERPQLIFLSKQNLIDTMNISAELGFSGVNIHIGSTKGDIKDAIKQVAGHLAEVLEKTSPESILFLENSAGSGNNIGSSFDHLVEIIELNKSNPRIKVCLDTQHMHASGYNISEDPIAVVDEAVTKFGEKFELIHLNDSKTEFNSKKDRHENLGEGLIGKEALKAFVTDSRLSNLSCVMEVPGFDGNGPDEKNMEILRSFFE